MSEAIETIDEYAKRYLELKKPQRELSTYNQDYEVINAVKAGWRKRGDEMAEVLKENSQLIQILLKSIPEDELNRLLKMFRQEDELNFSISEIDKQIFKLRKEKDKKARHVGKNVSERNRVYEKYKNPIPETKP